MIITIWISDQGIVATMKNDSKTVKYLHRRDLNKIKLYLVS